MSGRAIDISAGRCRRQDTTDSLLALGRGSECVSCAGEGEGDKPIWNGSLPDAPRCYSGDHARQWERREFNQPAAETEWEKHTMGTDGGRRGEVELDRSHFMRSDEMGFDCGSPKRRGGRGLRNARAEEDGF